MSQRQVFVGRRVSTIEEAASRPVPRNMGITKRGKGSTIVSKKRRSTNKGYIVPAQIIQSTLFWSTEEGNFRLYD